MKNTNSKKSLRKNTRGATMIEYSAVALLILVAGAATLKGLGGDMSTVFGKTSAAIK